MDVLRTGASLLGNLEPEGPDRPVLHAVDRMLASLGSMLAYWWAFHRDKKRPDTETDEETIAGHFLRLLLGRAPDQDELRCLDVSLILYAEHELNASTFTTRVIAATLSDMHSAVAGGVGALKGTLHGGAGEAVMRTLLEVGRLDNVDAFVDRALAEKRRLMGFGHRVYTAGDPRAAILKGMAEEACRQSGQALWYDLAVALHAKDPQQGFALLALDLDRFKPVNDTYGHPTGDILLALIGERLRDCIKPNETAARLGGDEFAILLEPGTDKERAVATAMRVLFAMEEPFHVDGLRLEIGVSIGIALHDDTMRNIDADSAVAIKATGVTPDYVAEMRGVFGGSVTADDLVGARGVGVDVAYARAMRALDARADLDEVIGARAVGVTPAYAQEMRGYFPHVTLDDLTSLRATGVTGGDIRTMRASGMNVSDPDDVVAVQGVMGAHGTRAVRGPATLKAVRPGATAIVGPNGVYAARRNPDGTWSTAVAGPPPPPDDDPDE